jgi:hypothetical protein
MGNLELYTTYHIHQGDHQDNHQQGGTLLEIERCSVQTMKESFVKDGRAANYCRTSDNVRLNLANVYNTGMHMIFKQEMILNIFRENIFLFQAAKSNNKNFLCKSNIKLADI